MDRLYIAILGCGTVGGGVAQIITEINQELSIRAKTQIVLKKIVELSPVKASERFNLPIGLFCGGGRDLTGTEANEFIREIISSDEIDLVVETIGGKSDFVFNLCLDISIQGNIWLRPTRPF